MVWGCFSVSAMGPLIEVQGTMDRFQYGEILKNTMLPYARAHLCEQWSFQHDNDPKHASKHVKGLLKKRKS